MATDVRTKTGFQVHVSQLIEADENVIDFTERRLLIAASRATTSKVKNNIMTLLKSYRSGNVTIAWSGGQAVFHQIEPRPRVERKTDPANG